MTRKMHPTEMRRSQWHFVASCGGAMFLFRAAGWDRGRAVVIGDRFQSIVHLQLGAILRIDCMAVEDLPPDTR
ncbi:hypothetical protein NB063_05625 [Rhodopirellula sp. ICT_H3.1]|uniref:Uncharacterized protein n=2 Tax=Aporhodopirellula aestuarii TaxID=2950107 RepID=A0ABT0TZS2_9BACT|nr:hypothetical protein [Aporhodopirellula aestuarii]